MFVMLIDIVKPITHQQLRQTSQFKVFKLQLSSLYEIEYEIDYLGQSSCSKLEGKKFKFNHISSCFFPVYSKSKSRKVKDTRKLDDDDCIVMYVQNDLEAYSQTCKQYESSNEEDTKTNDSSRHKTLTPPFTP